MPYPYSVYNQVFSQGIGGIAEALRRKREQEESADLFRSLLSQTDPTAVPKYGVAPSAEWQMGEDGQATQLPTPQAPITGTQYVQQPRPIFDPRNYDTLMQLFQTNPGMLNFAAQMQKQNEGEFKTVGQGDMYGTVKGGQFMPSGIAPPIVRPEKPENNLRFDNITVSENGTPVEYRVGYDQRTNKEVSRERVGVPWQTPKGPASLSNDVAFKAKAAFDRLPVKKELDLAISSADRIGDLIDATKAGNEVAVTQYKYALARIYNGTRLSDQDFKVSGVGVSLARKAQDWVRTTLEGKPSEATLEDIQEIAGAWTKAAQYKYNELAATEATAYSKWGNPEEVYGAIHPAPYFGEDYKTAFGRVKSSRSGATPASSDSTGLSGKSDEELFRMLGGK